MADHYVDIHRGALIQRVVLKDPILEGFLRQKLLSREQCDRVRSMATSQEQMRELLGYVESWGKDDKDQFLIILRSSGALKDVKV